MDVGGQLDHQVLRVTDVVDEHRLEGAPLGRRLAPQRLGGATGRVDRRASAPSTATNVSGDASCSAPSTPSYDVTTPHASARVASSVLGVASLVVPALRSPFPQDVEDPLGGDVDPLGPGVGLVAELEDGFLQQVEVEERAQLLVGAEERGALGLL